MDLLDEAERELHSVLDARLRILEPDHLDTLTTRNNLAAAYQSAGDLTESFSLFRENRNERLREFGADHPVTLASLNNPAGAYRYKAMLSGQD